MLYAIMSQDVENSLELRKKVRPDHIARLQQLKDAGRLVLAGPHPISDTNEPAAMGFTGSLVIAEFSSLAEAQAWADADPYFTTGVYKHVNVKPFKKVLP